MAKKSGFVIWFTGLPTSGKEVLCKIVFRELLDAGLDAEILDETRSLPEMGLARGKSPDELKTNDLIIAHLAKLLARHGVVVIVDTVAPYESVRSWIREQIGEFVEVYCPSPIHEASSEAVYEIPEEPDVIVSTEETIQEVGAGFIVKWLAEKGYVDMVVQ